MPLIAMTREMGSLGKDVAAGLAQRHGRKVVYHEIIEPIANKMRLRKSHVERFLEGKSGLWERLTTDRTSLSIFTADETFRFLQDGSTGVIRGWGAPHLLKDIPHVIRVRICAPFALRVERMMERLGSDNREAVESEIEMSEEAHSAITKRHFGIHWREPEHYDACLNTGRVSVDECIHELEALMQAPQFQETHASMRAQSDLALAWGVRSALRRDARTAQARFQVKCDDGVAFLSGMDDGPNAMDAALAVAHGVAGVREARGQVRAHPLGPARLKVEG